MRPSEPSATTTNGDSAFGLPDAVFGCLEIGNPDTVFGLPEALLLTIKNLFCLI